MTAAEAWPAGSEHIPARLRQIRACRGLSLRAAAELAGFSASYLSLIESGQRPLERLSTIAALAGALRVAPSELLDQFPGGQLVAFLAAEKDVLAVVLDRHRDDGTGRCRALPAHGDREPPLPPLLRPRRCRAGDGHPKENPMTLPDTCTTFTWCSGAHVALSGGRTSHTAVVARQATDPRFRDQDVLIGVMAAGNGAPAITVETVRAGKVLADDEVLVLDAAGAAAFAAALLDAAARAEPPAAG